MQTKRASFVYNYCRLAAKHGLLGFSKNSSPVFTESGFNNWKKAKEKFNSHASSLIHKEAMLSGLHSTSLP